MQIDPAMPRLDAAVWPAPCTSVVSEIHRLPFNDAERLSDELACTYCLVRHGPYNP